MQLLDFFHFGPMPSNQMSGNYDGSLIFLSYLVAVVASYIALDVTGRIRDFNNSQMSRTAWLIGGSCAMGLGIWSMHFIGMLAFQMDMPMQYDSKLTFCSMIVAVAASSLTFNLLKEQTVRWQRLGFGGIILGLSIASMHYIGMAAMNMTIHYIPWIFAVSIMIAITASEVALWLAIKSSYGTFKEKIKLKSVSALMMGFAICGMHYTGMAAAIFTPGHQQIDAFFDLSPAYLSLVIAIVSLIIFAVAFIASTYKEISNNQQIKLAHQQGMAEIASNVLHNVGNVLNSVVVSASVVNEQLAKSELKGLVELNTLMQKHKKNLAEFVQSDNGSYLPEYINILTEAYQSEKNVITQAMSKLIRNIKHIEEIIKTQQTFSILPLIEQKFSINDAIEEAIEIVNITNNSNKIIIEKQYSNLKPIIGNKVKTLQILINLIKNAKESILASGNKNGRLSIKTHINKEGYLAVVIADNGLGIKECDMPKLFTHGFTTKNNGKGFGLHACAIAANEMKGQLSVESMGVGLGATFTLLLQFQTNQNTDTRYNSELNQFGKDEANVANRI